MRAVLAPILSGILIGTSYIPLPPWALFFCLVPLWWSWLKAKSGWQIFWFGWITQALLTIIGFNWVAHTVREFGNIPFPINFIVLFAYAAIAHLHFPISGILWSWLSRRLYLSETGKLILLPVTFSFCELLYPMIFDWHFGYTWIWLGWPAYQVGEIIGFRGLSQISVFFNLAILWAYLKWPSKGLRSLVPAAACLFIFIALQGLGLYLRNRLPAPDKLARVGIVQANIGNLEKQYAEQGRGFRNHIVRKYLTGSAELIAKASSPQDVSFVIWPETAFPERIGFGQWDSFLTQQTRQFFAEKGVPLLTGAYGYQGENDVSNSILGFDRQGQPLVDNYSKTILLAFGEYFPGADWFPILREWIPEVGNFVRGRGPGLIHLENLKLGPQICYEGLFDFISRDLANLGADILINVTNDSWYGTWQQPYQHLYMTLARAIEVRRPLVRSTNTGISTVILANGEILEQSPLHQEWTHLYEVAYRENAAPTAFQSWGYYFVWILLAISLSIAVGWDRRGRPRQS